MAKTEVLQIRLTITELETWREAAELDGVSLSHYVRKAVTSKVKLDATLRDQADRARENRRMQRLAMQKLEEASAARRRRPTRDEMLRQLLLEVGELRADLNQ
jgi:hypothetical protein